MKKRKKTMKISEIRKAREPARAGCLRKIKSFFIAVGAFFITLLESCAI